MSEWCKKVCPAYLECQNVIDATAAEKDSLLKERGHLERAIQHRQNAEIAGAFAILNGELTVEEHDELIKKLEQNPHHFSIDYAERFARIDRDIQENDKTAEQVASAFSELSENIDICNGPTLGVVRAMVFNLRNCPGVSEKYSVVAAEAGANVRTLKYRLELLGHGHCSNPSAKQVAKRIPRLYWS